MSGIHHLSGCLPANRAYWHGISKPKWRVISLFATMVYVLLPLYWLPVPPNNQQIGLYQATGGNLVSGPTRDAKRPPLVPGDCLSAHHGSCAPEVFEKSSTGASSATPANSNGLLGAMTSPRSATDFVPLAWRISDKTLLRS